MHSNWATLKPRDWDGIHKVANSFKEELKHSSSAELEKFLPAAGDRLRWGTLLELVKVELAFRWEHGRGILIEHYLTKYPELGAAKDLPAALVYEEYRCRHEYGDRPALTDYQARFPERFAELQQLILKYPVHAPEATDRSGQGGNAGPLILAAGSYVAFGGGYTLLARIGAGTFGEVWHARSAGGGFEVAIKIIFRTASSQDVQRELQALEVVRGLRHPFLLSTQSYWLVAERLYIVMELADLSLAQRLQQYERQGIAGIPQAELLTYLRESAEALDYLHSKTVMHRDIKPENILLLQGHVKVADFGLVRLQDNLISIKATTTGTPLYMPPEVWEERISQHSDQYSLAMTYLHLRRGAPPYPSRNYLTVMRCHLERDPDLGDLPAAEKEVILRAVSKDPHKRYPSCLEFARAIEAALGVTSVTASGGGLAPPASVRQVTARPESTAGRAAAASAPSAAPGEYGTLRPPRTDPVVAIQTDDKAFAATKSAPPSTSEPSVSPSSRSRSAVVALVLLLGLLPCVYFAWHAFGDGSGNSAQPTLKIPEAVRIHAGKAVTFPLSVTGGNPGKLLRVFCTNLPADMKLEPAELTVTADAQEVHVRLAATPGARPRQVTLAFEASGILAPLSVTLLPLETLPPNCTIAAAATVETDRTGRPFYSRIDYHLPQGPSIPLLLIRAVRQQDPPTFYIMQDKVSNGVFGAFAKACSDSAAPGLVGTLASRQSGPLRGIVLALVHSIQRGEWRRGGKVDRLLNGQVETHDVGTANSNLPVFRVTAVEAHRCARWLGGFLPSAQQWDKAAGRFDRQQEGQPPREGPFQGVWKKNKATETDRVRIAVGRNLLGPMPLDKDTLDVSPFGCRHMSGNGKEWTDTLLGDGTVSGYADRGFRAESLVMLRGHTYRASRPLTFDLLEEDPEAVGARNPQEASPEIGFRIVIPAWSMSPRD